MALSDAEFEEILSDRTKQIVEDIRWTADLDHTPGMEFQVQVSSDSDWRLAVYGSWYPHRATLFFTLVMADVGAIFRMCIGFEGHRNPDGTPLAPVHFHRWTSQHEDHWADAPGDKTADWDQPGPAWRQFCAEARILHSGALFPPQA